MAISKEDQERLERMKSIIIQNITNPNFSIDFLARALAINRDKLYQSTKKITGLTANQYVREIRLEMAKGYLENKTYTTVKEVANRVGFRRVDYFVTRYKEAYGKSPSEYLKS
jgi:AraC-like DNA-binding protein